MPKNKVNDPITDKEIAFARLILSGAMTDRQAAEAVGLNPDSAAYTKAKPRVRAYMLEHRAAVRARARPAGRQPMEQWKPAPKLDRQQVLDRLWEIAKLGPEMTRGSVTGQVKALSIIVAMENFIPDRRAVSAEKKSAPAPTPQIDAPEAAGPSQSTSANRTTTSESPVPLSPPVHFCSRPGSGFSHKKDPS